MQTEEKAGAKPSQVRTFPNGLVIEKLAMGIPDGKKAAPGKKVHYILLEIYSVVNRLFISYLLHP